MVHIMNTIQVCRAFDLERRMRGMSAGESARLIRRDVARGWMRNGKHAFAYRIGNVTWKVVTP